MANEFAIEQGGGTGLNITITRKQHQFIRAGATEVLFGGAAGGGKSYGQIIDALLYACKYKGSKQLILRRTYPELERSLIRTALMLYPKKICTYNSSKHVMQLVSGSLIDFGYCDNENDVYQYQSAEYDTIRFDELTHFTQDQYLYLISRLRGANAFPKQVKSSTNPGGVGHAWVKERFVDIGAPNTEHQCLPGTRIFIPAKAIDNKYLMEADPEYIKRLENLPEMERKALLYGDWDLFEGQYFTEFSRETHVVKPFKIPEGWRVYRAMDYGLDMTSCLWIAVNSLHEAVVYKELNKPDLPVGEAAREIHGMTNGERIYMTLAPPDLWGRSQESGRSKADLFREAGLELTKTSNDREAGWLSVKELLRPVQGGSRLKIFDTCTTLIKHIPSLQHDAKNPTDVATQPHEITHAPDALRAFCVYWHSPQPLKDKRPHRKWREDQWQDYFSADEEGKAYLISKWGVPE